MEYINENVIRILGDIQTLNQNVEISKQDLKDLVRGLKTEILIIEQGF